MAIIGMECLHVLAKLLRTAGALSVLAVSTTVEAAAEPAGATSPAQTTAAAWTRAEQDAIDRAREALDQRHDWIDGLAVESVAASQWPNSSLGCPRPGVNYLQVITSGYTVKFTGKDARREVRVAGGTAVVCGDTLSIRPRIAQTRLTMPGGNLSSMIAAARTDLAARIGAEPDELTLIEWAPLRLPARVLRCEVAADPDSSAVPGYKIVLGYGGRTFPYQSDRNSAVDCPPIRHE